MQNGETNKQLVERLDFYGLDSEALEVLGALKDDVDLVMDQALEHFYSEVSKVPDLVALFADETRMSYAKNQQRQHWSRIASGVLDNRYVEAVTNVGLTHARIGLEPRWYIGGYGVLLEHLLASIVEKRWPSRFGRGKAHGLAKEIGLLVKAALLDMDYSVSVYLDKLEDERRKAEAERLSLQNEQDIAIEKLKAALEIMAGGDLEKRMDEELPGNLVAIAEYFNESAEHLRQTLAAIRSAADPVTNSADEIYSASEDLSSRTERQAASVEQSSAALTELSESVRSTAESAATASQDAVGALDVARKSGSIVNEAVTAMGEIEKSSDDISKIIGVIDSIAFQTNLLALNAGVEAARAGDAGKGFAVVAQEVRELAQRSASAAREISDIISKSSAQVATGVDLVSQSGRSLEEIIQKVSGLNELIENISRASTEQSSGIGEISSAMNEIDSITQNNAHMVEQTTETSRNLTAQVKRMVDALRGFKTRDPEASGGRQDGPERRGLDHHQRKAG